ncbi:MAG: sugar ABC transporter permease [Actinomycetota bacterium]|jgi:multiple sugar transport system permease protein|nr:MAG: sugar ABC transporter permease [Actinomycetota bacterium]
MRRGDPQADGLGSPAPRRSLRERAALLYVAPAWIAMLAVFAIPLLFAAYLSLRSETLTSFLPGRFVGLQNYRGELTSPIFLDALRTTLILMAMALAIQLPAGLGLALVLHRELRGTRLFRSALLIPMLLTPVAVGLMWRFMFDADLGIIGWGLEQIGLHRIDWLGDPWPARWAIVIVDSWQAIPFVMLLCLAGLAGLPDAPFEAAIVDGASRWQVFRYVTLPMLAPVLLVVTMIRVIDSFKLFDILFILTRGGPGTATQTLGMLNYNVGFNFLATSRAAALGIVLTVLAMPVYVLWVRVTGRSR